MWLQYYKMVMYHHNISFVSCAPHSRELSEWSKRKAVNRNTKQSDVKSNKRNASEIGSTSEIVRNREEKNRRVVKQEKKNEIYTE